ncbi:MAG: hypothetical protein AB7F43_12305 [Bacteriovoracia bacterium]
MLKLVSKLLILLCLWSVTFGVYPSFSTDVEGGVQLTSVQDSSQSLTADHCDAGDSHHSANPGCSACHLGHCQFDARTTNAAIQFVPVLSSLAVKQVLFTSFYPSSPIKPPSA